ncbi:MAG TPA: hypothetical protein VFE06_17105, partial [Acidobacteriaceae bacterium]|nr:hypothetical protein [Acidobacteriaceae bacterium]
MAFRVVAGSRYGTGGQNRRWFEATAAQSDRAGRLSALVWMIPARIPGEVFAVVKCGTGFADDWISQSAWIYVLSHANVSAVLPFSRRCARLISVHMRFGGSTWRGTKCGCV